MLALMQAPQVRLAAEGGWRRDEAGERPSQPALRHLLATFDLITLAQMSGAALLDRSEIKYVMPLRLLVPVLADLRGAYRVLVVAGQPFSRYRTLYFDTGDLAMYRRHHAGAPDR